MQCVMCVRATASWLPSLPLLDSVQGQSADQHVLAYVRGRGDPGASLPEGLEKVGNPLQFSCHGVGVSGMQAQIPARGKQGDSEA